MSRQRSSLRRDRDQLARVLGAIVLAMSPAGAALVACDSVSGSAPLDADGSTADGSISAPPSDAGVDVETGAAPLDAACAITATYYDSGTYYDGGDGAIDVGCIYNLPCGLPPTLEPIGCTLYFAQTGSDDAQAPAGCIVAEGQGCTSGAYTPGPGGAVSVICTDCLGGGGRRPRGLARPKGIVATNAVGAYFARMAHEEGASVFAFHRMKQELLRFGAPTRLVRAAERATRDERRHAAVMARLTRRFGGACASVRVRAAKERSLEAAATENVIEGCVNETFGALLMTWQAHHAATPTLRETFARIARDETAHAALSRAVAAWAESLLGDGARARVARARARAVRRLQRSADRLENEPFAKTVGWPTPTERRRLVQEMITSLGLA